MTRPGVGPVASDGARDRPLVAITATLEPASGREPRETVWLEAAYLQELERLGLALLILTPAHDPATLDALMERVSGLVLSGGEDVDPARYGETPAPGLEAVSPGRDALEYRLLEAALSRGLPVLAICRGIQLLNVFLGGTLYQDLPSQLEGALPHTGPPERPAPRHRLRVEPGSRLHGLVGATEVETNSFHHQAIRDVASGLRPTAVAGDGVVEAVEPADPARVPWLLGVQWHPERRPGGAAEDTADRRILGAFRDAVSNAAADERPDPA